MKQRIWAIFAILLLLLTLAMPAMATEPEELDPVTGLPLGNYETADGQIGSYITVDDSFRYDPDAKCFLYALGDVQYSSNIPKGALLPTDTTVCIQIPGGLTPALYRNGAVVENADLTKITEPGFYVLQLSGTNLYDNEQFNFTIVPSVTNGVNELYLPDGFSFEYIKKDGKDQFHDYANYHEFLEDGQYQLCWKNDSIDLKYTVKFTLDRQAPTLALPEVENGKANSPVSLTDLEPGCYIVLERDGETTTLKGNQNVLKDTGTYNLTVYDLAGNSTKYQFTIQLYLNISAVFVIILLVAIMVGILIYCYRVRKNTRVG